jgi:hypothetical protein
MKLRIAEMGDGMFEVQKEMNPSVGEYKWINAFEYLYYSLGDAKEALAAHLKSQDSERAARTVVRVWE